MFLRDSFNYSDSVIKEVNIDVNTIFLEAKTKKNCTQQKTYLVCTVATEQHNILKYIYILKSSF